MYPCGVFVAPRLLLLPTNGLRRTFRGERPRTVLRFVAGKSTWRRECILFRDLAGGTMTERGLERNFVLLIPGGYARV